MFNKIMRKMREKARKDFAYAYPDLTQEEAQVLRELRRLGKVQTFSQAHEAVRIYREAKKKKMEYDTIVQDNSSLKNKDMLKYEELPDELRVALEAKKLAFKAHSMVLKNADQPAEGFPQAEYSNVHVKEWYEETAAPYGDDHNMQTRLVMHALLDVMPELEAKIKELEAQASAPAAEAPQA